MTQLVGVLQKDLEARKTEEREALLDQTAKELSASYVDVNSALDMLRFLSRQLAKEETQHDKVEDIVADLGPFGFVPKGREAELTTFFTSLRDLVVKEEGRAFAREFERGLLPRLHSFGATVEVRAVFKRKTLPEDDQYKPQMLGAVPVATVKMTLTSNENNEFYFQLRDDEVESLMKWRKSLSKELQEAKKNLRLQ